MRSKIAFLLSVLTLAMLAYAGTNVSKQMPAQITSIAATSTNTTKGTSVSFGQDAPQTVRIYAQGSGGVGATGNMIVRFELDSGTNWDSAAQSYIYLTLPITGVSTNQVSDFFTVSGAQQIREGQIENGASSTVSNIRIWMTYEHNK